MFEGRAWNWGGVVALLLALGACGTSSDHGQTPQSAALGEDRNDMGAPLPDDFAMLDVGLPQRGDTGVGEDAGTEIAAAGQCDTSEEEPGHFYSFSAQPMEPDADALPMCQYRDRVLLIVNTAALCGFTPQYAQLQALQDRFAHRGFDVLGFLSNDFGEQVGSAEEIEECESIYGLTFRQFAEVGVLPTSQQGQHPIFSWLTNQPGFEGDVEWNFIKFLVDGSGQVVGRWGSLILPDSPEVIDAIESALGSWP